MQSGSMKDEAISSSRDPLLPPRSSSPPPTLTPAASSAGASSPAVPANVGSTDWFGQGQNSKGGSVSRIGLQPVHAALSTSADGSVLGSSQPSCRPWERGDLLKRLSTFKPTNWFGKPKAASSLVCARRGWVNVGVDKIECESCGAILEFVSSSTWTPSQENTFDVILDTIVYIRTWKRESRFHRDMDRSPKGITHQQVRPVPSFTRIQIPSSSTKLLSSSADAAGEDFAKRLDEGHKVSCPWIGNSCAESLVQFPPTPPSALIGGYKDRCDGLLQFPSLPIVAASTIEQIRVSRGPEIDRLLVQSQFAGIESGIKLEILLGNENSKDDVFFVYSRAQKLISLCGWEPRWLPNVQDCEEHSAQSARNGCSIGPSRYRGPPRDPGRGKKALSSSVKKDNGKNELVIPKSKSVSRSPLLDCSLCGGTVRIWDFLCASRPACFVPSSSDVAETSKKMALTRGISAASGISGWVAEKEQTEDHDEDVTGEGKSFSNIGVDLNLTISAGLSSSRVNMNVMSDQYQDLHRGRDLLIGQPSSSEVGNRAASYESHGPSSRKRNLDEGGSTVDRPPLFSQQADSIEGTIIDRDGDEVDDGRQYSACPSKRARDYEFEPRQHGKDYFGAGPSRTFGFDMGIGAPRDDLFDQAPEQILGYPSARDSTRASSVIAMDTICRSDDNDSMESVENNPGDFYDINLPSTSTVKNADPNETSELDYSNQAQQSTCPAAVRSAGEMGISSTNEEEVVNADTATAHGIDGPSFGISGGSVGMGASHEAEIHGAASIYRADSLIGEVEPIAEITDNQTGEFAPDPGLMGDFVPEEMDREDPHGDSQELMSRSVGRADSGSKILGSAKAESVESGEKTINVGNMHCENNPHPSLSCNAVLCSGFEASKEEVTQAAKDSTPEDCGYAESGYLFANGSGPPNGGSNYDEAVEFDPIKHHNYFCPWVNGNVAAAGCSSSGSSGSTAGAVALCGWQLTLDALDAFQSQGQVPVQTVESESAASMYKDDHRTPGRKLLAHHSFNKSRGQS